MLDKQYSTEQLELIKNKIIDLIQHAALERIRLHSRIDDFELADQRTIIPPGTILGNWMALILVSGDALRITFKLHFSHAAIRKIAYPIYGKSSAEELSKQQIFDFVKELCNLSAGYLVQIFEDNHLHIGISLPLCTRGFYELYADYSPSSYPIIKYSHIWSMDYDAIQILGSAIIEILDISALEHILEYEFLEADDDEMDFL